MGALGWKHVTLPSRPDKDGNVIRLRGLYLPSGLPSSPTIVLQHGRSADINNARVQATAFMLRSMNFNVIMVNLRNFGNSDKTKDGKLSWANEAYDVLGAWDYVVNDPDQQLGGAKSPSQVGIHGISLGGYV